jgi:hypothetical protein
MRSLFLWTSGFTVLIFLNLLNSQPLLLRQTIEHLDDAFTRLCGNFAKSFMSFDPDADRLVLIDSCSHVVILQQFAESENMCTKSPLACGSAGMIYTKKKGLIAIPRGIV